MYNIDLHIKKYVRCQSVKRIKRLLHGVSSGSTLFAYKTTVSISWLRINIGFQIG